MKAIAVRSAALPSDSVLWSRVTSQDFLDCFAVRAVTTPRIAAEIITEFPKWARGLLQIRGIIVAPFGLSQDGPEAVDKVGPFPVESETDHELIAGFNDKHLDFRVSVIAKEGCVSLATWVHVHNLGGRLYLNAIMPFHILIARDALRRVAVATRKSKPEKETRWT
ncbi:MAG: DUF2867 domain-containing protein [Pseudomonadota bacterium]